MRTSAMRFGIPARRIVNASVGVIWDRAWTNITGRKLET
jgi:hypothetical protein